MFFKSSLNTNELNQYFLVIKLLFSLKKSRCINNFQFSWKFSQGFSSTYDGGVPVKFKKLIRFIGAELKPPLYDFIIHADSNQTERLENTRQNKKKDSKSFASGKVNLNIN